VSKLQLNPQRFRTSEFTHPHFVNRPLRILFYFEQKTDRFTVEQTLSKSSDIWDFVFILFNEQGRSEVAISKSIPLGKELAESLYLATTNTQSIPGNIREQKLFWFKDVPFVLSFQTILRSIPSPIIVDVMQTFMKIADYAFKK
jgi:hypothetical protein